MEIEHRGYNKSVKQEPVSARDILVSTIILPIHTKKRPVYQKIAIRPLCFEAFFASCILCTLRRQTLSPQLIVRPQPSTCRNERINHTDTDSGHCRILLSGTWHYHPQIVVIYNTYSKSPLAPDDSSVSSEKPHFQQSHDSAHNDPEQMYQKRSHQYINHCNS